MTQTIDKEENFSLVFSIRDLGQRESRGKTFLPLWSQLRPYYDSVGRSVGSVAVISALRKKVSLLVEQEKS